MRWSRSGNLGVTASSAGGVLRSDAASSAEAAPQLVTGICSAVCAVRTRTCQGAHGCTASEPRPAVAAHGVAACSGKRTVVSVGCGGLGLDTRARVDTASGLLGSETHSRARAESRSDPGHGSQQPQGDRGDVRRGDSRDGRARGGHGLIDDIRRHHDHRTRS